MSDYKWLKVPLEFEDVGLDAFVPQNASQQAVHNRVTSWVESTYPTGSSKGLLLAGSPGLGKSMLAAAVLNALDPPHGFVSMFDYEKWLRNLMSYSDMARVAEKVQDLGKAADLLNRWERLEERIRLIRALPLLVLDDVGKEHLTSSNWLPAELHRLLRGRYIDGRPTIITTNHKPDEWASVYGSAMASFIWEAYEVLPFEGADYRIPDSVREAVS